MLDLRRRQFLTLLGGAAAAWPRAARAQQTARRRIAVFMPGVADDPEYAARNAAFLKGSRHQRMLGAAHKIARLTGVTEGGVQALAPD
jgi:hypothetical protein